ncbi:hypothetical protein CGI99_19505 [Vibrio parahaemolyticus]|nr:hypothetical protein CGI99_19505 [Vibrio parahaemolyticus]
MDNFFLIPGLPQLMNGFRTVNAVDVLLFLLCLIGVAFLQNMSPIMEKIIEPCAFPILIY